MEGKPENVHVRRTPGVDAAIDIIREKLACRNPSDAVRDALCYLAENVRNADEAKLAKVRDCVALARARQGVR
jgi:hypothetical protein